MKDVGSSKVCLFRISAKGRAVLEKVLFQRYPSREWGTFFRFGYRITSWGIHITFVDAIEPRPGDLKRDSGIVEFDAGYILRAQLSLNESQLAVGVAHSHPFGGGTFASPLDDDMDEYFAREFAIYGYGRPYVSLRVARGPDNRFAFSGECWLGGEVIDVVNMLTVGEELTREVTEVIATVIDESRFEETARVAELLGDDKVGRLKHASVAIVGCSGTGSPAAHVLARAGVKRFVLVDPQVFERSNHERFHASYWRDLERTEPKVQLIRRMILDINPTAEVIPVRGNVLDEPVLDELLRCDLVLGCTDNQHSRAALSDYATHYILPCIDSAVLMRAREGKLMEQVGEFARYTAEEPCAWCLGRLNQKTVWYELMSEEERESRRRAAKDAIARGVDGEQYWGGEPPRELTVGYLTTAVGSIQAGYALGWLTGASQMPHQRFQFDICMPLLGAVCVDKSPRPECSCNYTKGWGDQARADRSVSAPFRSLSSAVNGDEHSDNTHDSERGLGLRWLITRLLRSLRLRAGGNG